MKRIGFLGGGKMAEGILGAIPAKRGVVVCEKVATRAADLAKRYGVATTDDPRVLAAKARLVFLAVRPQDVDAVAAQLKGVLTAGHTLVSIVAGKTLAKLRAAFGPDVRLIRVMPNLALRAQAGMCAVCPGPRAPKADVGQVLSVLGGAGETVVLREGDFDAVTALSGSGPAYFAYMQLAMEEGGVALGLRPSVARLLAAQTMYGTAKFLKESGLDLSAFIDGVATKGGTTAAGLARLAAPAFRRTVAAALAAAAARARALGR